MTHDGAHPDAHERPEVWGPRLVRILDRQLACARALLELARGQAGLIENERSDDLIALLAERQSRVDEIDRLAADLEPFTARWDDLAPALDSAHRAAIADRTGELERILAEVTTLDDADRQALETRRSEMADRINTVSRRRHAVAAYGPPPGGRGPRFQDREG